MTVCATMISDLPGESCKHLQLGLVQGPPLHLHHDQPDLKALTQAVAYRYLQDEQHLVLSPKSLQVGSLSPDGHMQIDSVSIESLELVKAVRTGRGSAHKCDTLFRWAEAVETGRSSALSAIAHAGVLWQSGLIELDESVP